MLIAASKHQNAKMESHYELVKAPANGVKNPCALCKRSDGEVVGPFAKRNQLNQLWLHKDCIEVNTYSYYSTTFKKWVNID